MMCGHRYYIFQPFLRPPHTMLTLVTAPIGHVAKAKADLKTTPSAALDRLSVDFNGSRFEACQLHIEIEVCASALDLASHCRILFADLDIHTRPHAVQHIFKLATNGVKIKINGNFRHFFLILSTRETEAMYRQIDIELSAVALASYEQSILAQC